MKLKLSKTIEADDVDVRTLAESIADDPVAFVELVRAIIHPWRTGDNPLAETRFNAMAVAEEIIRHHPACDWERLFAVTDAVRHLKRTGA